MTSPLVPDPERDALWAGRAAIAARRRAVLTAGVILVLAGLLLIILGPSAGVIQVASGALGVGGALVLLIGWTGFDTTRSQIAARPPAEAALPPVNQAAIRDRAVRRIAQVQDEYASRITDIAYVIEHQGMFDLAHEPARELTALLAQAQDLDPQLAELTDLRRLAGELQVAWQHAEQYADRLGYSALRGDQDAARQAAGLSRKAAAAGVSEPERQALLERVRLILATLDLVVPQPITGQLSSSLVRELPAEQTDPY